MPGGPLGVPLGHGGYQWGPRGHGGMSLVLNRAVKWFFQHGHKRQTKQPTDPRASLTFLSLFNSGYSSEDRQMTFNGNINFFTVVICLFL